VEITAYTQYDYDSRAGNGQQTPDEDDDDTIEVLVIHDPALHVTTATNPSKANAAGEVILYTVYVENVGNINLTGITVNDPEMILTYQSGDTNGDSVLDVTETWVYTGSYTVTQAEMDSGDPIQTQVTADSNESLLDSIITTIPIVQNPDILVTMDSDVHNVVAAGEVIHYTVTLENTGNITLTYIEVIDTPDISLVYISGDTDGDGKLDVGETWIYTGSYTVTQADINASLPIHTEVTVSYEEGDSETAVENVTIGNTAPVAVEDAYSMHWSDTSLAVDAEHGILANDSDANLDPLTAVIVTTVANGTLTLELDGSFLYAPADEFDGPSDTFTYRAYDGYEYSDPVTVTIELINTPPTAAPDEYSTWLNQTLTVGTANGILHNDGDADGDLLQIDLIAGPAPEEGNLVLNEDGSFTFTPAYWFTGDGTFTYRVYDGLEYSNAVLVTIHVGGIQIFLPIIVRSRKYQIYLPVTVKP
jgi:uncharacterized repeat protein (TIGR01451 family)